MQYCIKEGVVKAMGVEIYPKKKKKKKSFCRTALIVMTTTSKNAMMVTTKILHSLAEPAGKLTLKIDKCTQVDMKRAHAL